MGIETLRHHVTGAIERGEAQPIAEVRAPESRRESFSAIAVKYCNRQDSTPAALLAVLKGQRDRFNPAGWFLAECQDMSSSAMGSLVILPYGPQNTFKEVPDPGRVFSPRGLASDMSTAVAFLAVEDLPNELDEVALAWQPPAPPKKARKRKAR